MAFGWPFWDSACHAHAPFITRSDDNLKRKKCINMKFNIILNPLNIKCELCDKHISSNPIHTKKTSISFQLDPNFECVNSSLNHINNKVVYNFPPINGLSIYLSIFLMMMQCASTLLALHTRTHIAYYCIRHSSTNTFTVIKFWYMFWFNFHWKSSCYRRRPSVNIFSNFKWQRANDRTNDEMV